MVLKNKNTKLKKEIDNIIFFGIAKTIKFHKIHKISLIDEFIL